MTANAAVLVGMREDPQFREACLASDLIIADGMSVIWASRLLGAPASERVTGVDLMQRLLEAGSTCGLRVFLLGARQDVLEDLVQSCHIRYPGFVLAGCRNGYFGKTDEREVVAQVRASRPDVLFIGMPSPNKEIWAHRHRNALGAAVIIGVGGSFDVLAGHVRRAPRAIQAAGLEWLWRLIMEPRKLWRRYLRTNPAFVGLILRQLLDRGRPLD
jgi:N-acetylglucosaminyldiphosphoundecaprenol N-acetyl-beta-D-mannosaminyltransferase